jgi:hypothetical protein
MVHTKSITKIIAALGVVAGLGVAALPLASYAANEQTADVDITVTVGGTFSLVAFGTTSNKITLNPDLTSIRSDTASATVVSNITGSYDLYIGTPYSGDYDTTILYNTSVTPTTGADDGVASNYKIPANAGLTAGTAGWAYKFTGATYCNGTGYECVINTTNGIESTLDGAITPDTGWVAPTEFSTCDGTTVHTCTGGRRISQNQTIPNGDGDIYTFSVGAAIGAGTQSGNYEGTLLFYAATN